DLAAFRELEAFAQLGTELDKATQSQLDRGYRMVELLKQPQYVPLHVADQVVAIYAGTKGYFDTVPVSDVQEAEKELHEFIRTEHADMRDRLVAEAALTDEIEADLKKALEAFVVRRKARA
ncbi:MAG: F0F1 ATP synthase subunit alpha, partial [Planctomycetaceae bacterium]